MKTHSAILSTAAALVPLMLAGCSSSSVPGNNAVEATTAPVAAPTANGAAPAAVAPTPSPTPAASAVVHAEKTGLLDYSYKYPAGAAAIPALKAMLDTRADAARTKALADARQDREAAAKSGFPFHPHEYNADWTTVADTPRFLSLVGTIGTYTGGAHGMTVFDPLLWDRRNDKPLAVAELFTSHQALESALRSRFCDALDQERARRRGEPVKHDDDPFDACIDPAQEAIAPTAGGQGTIDGLTVYVAPYDAGPYAEGDYRIPVAIDAALLNAIKPAYRDAFSAATKER